MLISNMFHSSKNMLTRKIFVLAILFTLSNASDILNHGYVDRMECKLNEEYCPQSTCKLSFITRKVKSLNIMCNLTKQVDTTEIQVTLYYRYRAGYKKFLIDVNIDVCAYFENKLGSALVELVRKTLEEYSTNFMHGCPYFGNVTIIGLPLTAILLNNLFVPAGEYKLVIKSKLNKERLSLALMTFYFTVPAGRTLEDDNMG